MQITALLIIVTTLVVPFHICKSQTQECNVINQYYGSEFKELALNFDNERPKNNGHRGEPGKRGPKGGRGMPGQKVSLYVYKSTYRVHFTMILSLIIPFRANLR